jgi:hypothetical protein
MGSAAPEEVVSMGRSLGILSSLADTSPGEKVLGSAGGKVLSSVTTEVVRCSGASTEEDDAALVIWDVAALDTDFLRVNMLSLSTFAEQGRMRILNLSTLTT